MLDGTLILAFVILISGWIPPFVVFYMTYRLSERTLKKADKIREEALGTAEGIRSEVKTETESIRKSIENIQNESSMAVGDLRGDLYRFQREFKQSVDGVMAVSLTPKREKDLLARIESEIGKHALTEERLTSIKKDLKKSLTKSIDGKIGAEIKRTKDDLMRDPQTAAMVEQYEATGGDINMGQTILFRMMNSFFPKQ